MTAPTTLTLDAAKFRAMNRPSDAARLHRAVKDAAALLTAAGELLSGPRGWEAEDRRATESAFVLAQEAVGRVRVVLEAAGRGDGDSDAGGEQEPDSAGVRRQGEPPDGQGSVGDFADEGDQGAEVVVPGGGSEAVGGAVVDELGQSVHAPESGDPGSGDAR